MDGFSGGAIVEWLEGISWASPRVVLCGAVGVVLLVLALLLRGLQKVIMIAAVLSLLLGGYWWFHERWGAPDVVPRELQAELDRVADRSLKDAEARAAWDTVKREWGHLSGKTKERLLAGGDPARAAIAQRLEAKAAELRKQGKKAAAEEVVKFRREVDPE